MHQTLIFKSFLTAWVQIEKNASHFIHQIRCKLHFKNKNKFIMTTWCTCSTDALLNKRGCGCGTCFIFTRLGLATSRDLECLVCPTTYLWNTLDEAFQCKQTFLRKQWKCNSTITVCEVKFCWLIIIDIKFFKFFRARTMTVYKWPLHRLFVRYFFKFVSCT